MATSCQKLASCSPVQTASLAARLSGPSVPGRAIQREQQASDRIGRAAAVVEHVGKGRVAAHGHVLREGGQEVAERGRGQGHARGSRRPALGRAARRGCSPAAIVSRWRSKAASAARRSAGRRVAFVGEVVRGAREAVDRHDGGAQGRGHEARGHREILVMADSHASGSHSAAILTRSADAAFADRERSVARQRRSTARGPSRRCRHRQTASPAARGECQRSGSPP